MMRKVRDIWEFDVFLFYLIKGFRQRWIQEQFDEGNEEEGDGDGETIQLDHFHSRESFSFLLIISLLSMSIFPRLRVGCTLLFPSLRSVGRSVDQSVSHIFGGGCLYITLDWLWLLLLDVALLMAVDEIAVLLALPGWSLISIMLLLGF